MEEKDPNKEREFQEYQNVCGDIHDPVLLILRTHLYIEYMLERLIIAKLDRGDRIVEKGRLSFAQKLVLVSAFDYVKDIQITMMRNLNAVRNRCAHERQKEITMADIELIGRPLGKAFSEIRKAEHDDILTCLRSTLDTICGSLGAYTHYLEENDETAGSKE